ncbi:kinase-like protein [Rhizophagus irregularis]|uniref:Kinase-like protein n=1 Tax=Rhizophagus irregularis TaxID=588596 RepID=A0A2N0S4U8_9GLOM|nr:kinase-like protein [Rhizophagus irregularis]
MSITEKQNKNFNYVDWIRKAIENNFITYYDYNEFKNKKIIENSVGKIFKANWNNTNTNLVVKTSYELDVKKIVNELKAQKEVNFHKNILQIYGISKLDNQYSLLLEYADGGSLYSYLKKSFTKLEWDDKYCLASQLANAIDFIHSKGIIHCNLHEENVLIHKNSIKVADFGLSKRANEISNYSNKVLDFLPYLDPKSFNDAFDIKCESEPHIMNFKSDIYSIGVLFWLLSSGRRPFYDEGTQYDKSLATEIVNGKREEIVEDTPVEYSDIYTACWSDDPDERPSIQIVVSCLKSIIDYSIKFITNEIENNDLKYMRDDYDLSIYDNFSKIMIDDNSSLNTFDYVKNKLLILNLTDLTDNVEKIVDKLIDHLIRIHDELCYIPTEAKEIINQNIQNIDKFLQIKIFDWLIRNQTSSKYIFFRGFLYYNGIIIINKDEDKAIRLFSKASKDNYPIAQFYLGKLYKDSKKAFYWYQKSAENGSKLAQFYLGKCYENGNGIEKDNFKAFKFYEKASISGNKVVQFNLGRCYLCGIGIEKDYDKSIEWFEKSASQGYIITQLLLGILYEKLKKDFENSFCWIERAMKRARKFKKSHLSAHYDNLLSAQKDDFKLFELYERSAEQGCYSAIYILGHLYINGIGFGKKLKESVHLIEKAAKKGNKYAQLYLARFYEEGIIVEKSRVEAFKWYKNAANDGNKYAQVILGLYFEKGGYGFVKKDIKKAVWWYEKSAEQDYAYAQCCLGYLYEKGEEIDRDSRKAIYWYKKAAENGYDAAYYLLAKFYEVVEKNEAKAFKYIKYYIEKGYFKGMYVLIGYYKRGIGTDIDREKADNLLKIATKIKKLKKTDTIS